MADLIRTGSERFNATLYSRYKTRDTLNVDPSNKRKIVNEKKIREKNREYSENNEVVRDKDRQYSENNEVVRDKDRKFSENSERERHKDWVLSENNEMSRENPKRTASQLRAVSSTNDIVLDQMEIDQIEHNDVHKGSKPESGREIDQIEHIKVHEISKPDSEIVKETCVMGKCLYCTRENAMCASDTEEVEGAVIVYLEQANIGG